MAKMIISENRLQELINESIYEVLQETQYNEGIGTVLGNGVRNAKKLPSKIKNSWNSFKNDFNTAKNNEPQDNQDVTGKPRSLAGLYGYAKERYWQKKKDWGDKVAAGGNYARHKYKDRDVVRDEYGQEMANNIRDYGTEPYRQDRLNNWRAQRGLEPQGVQPHPALAQNAQNNQNKRHKKKKNNGQQQGVQQQPVQQQQRRQQQPTQQQKGQQRPAQQQQQRRQQQSVQQQREQQQPTQQQQRRQQPPAQQQKRKQ